MELPLALALIVALLALAGLVYLLHARTRQLHARDRELVTLRGDLERFRSITDVEAEVARMRTQVAMENQQMQTALANEQARVHAEIAEARRIGQGHFDQVGRQMVAMQQEAATLEQRLVVLRRETAELDDALMFAEHGLYRPHYDFETSEHYRKQIDQVRDYQKRLVKQDQAAVCRTTWTVEGNAAKGRKMVGDKIKLMLRAFNGECDAAVAKVRYDNFHVLDKRIEKSFEAVNKLAAVNQCEITDLYFRLKRDELRLVHEYQEKLQAEREEQRMIKERMRDEQLAAKELEKAERDAAKEEARIAELLAKAQEQAEKTAAGAKHDQLARKVADLEAQLRVAGEQRQRAISRAQQTRSGHVYVISNIGSFGEDVYKIGMTRRYDPLDRVKELGDASVPFRFDVHALIYCDDAPTLETKLHRALADHQVNLVNSRKEFFRVTLAQVEAIVRELHGQIVLTQWAEAEEYRKTEALRRTRSVA
ncbi:DUF4041 domain-containing protein [Nannocystaceae bacterium ST9]